MVATEGDDVTRATAASTRGASLGVRLRQLRERAGFSQELLAERAGVAVNTLAALEAGRRRQPHPQTIALLADALALGPAERNDLHDLAGRAGASAGAVAASPTPAAPLSERRAALPAPVTPLIGRETEIDRVGALLDPLAGSTRLLTLVGPGGVGKTRLAVAVAERLVNRFVHGVGFVDLAPLDDYRLVPTTIADALGLREPGAGLSGVDLLRQHLGNAQLLLVLDNFEHLLDAAPLIAEVLGACVRLRVLVTSRAPLRVRAEQRLSVEPLPTPDDRQALDVIDRSPAVRLFIDRAQTISREFGLTPANAAAVAAICRRLDGIPLAIELAAPRLKLLAPPALLARLDHALPLLTGGGRDAPLRHRTMRATIEWSYGLLDEDQRALFRRLAVFASGCTLEAAATVCSAGSPEIDVFEGVGALIDNNLLQVRQEMQGESRCALLETIREFARETLQQSGEETAVQERHAQYILGMLEDVEPRLYGPEQVRWARLLIAEQDNVRAALRWSLDTGAFERVSQLLRGVAYFWWLQGRTSEAARWAEEVLSTPEVGTHRVLQARATVVVGLVAMLHSDKTGVARLREARALALEVGDDWVVRHSLALEGFLAPLRGDIAGGLALMRQAHQHARAAGDEWVGRLALLGLSSLSVLAGRLDEAEGYGEECLALARGAGDLRGIAHACDALAIVALARGEFQRVAALLRDALVLSMEVGQIELVTYALMGLAVVAAGDEPLRAVRQFGAAEALREEVGVAIWPSRKARYDQALANTREQLGPVDFETAWADGRAMTLQAAVEYALER